MDSAPETCPAESLPLDDDECWVLSCDLPPHTYGPHQELIKNSYGGHAGTPSKFYWVTWQESDRIDWNAQQAPHCEENRLARIELRCQNAACARCYPKTAA